MNQGQFTALLEQLQEINRQLGELLAELRPPKVWAFDRPAAETETPQGAALDPSCRTEDPAPAPAPGVIFPDAPPVRRFRKAKGGG